MDRSDPRPLLICFAVSQEAAPVRHLASPRVILLVTGMGRRNAGAVFQAAVATPETRPALVLTCGFAGGLDPVHPRGTVIFETDPAPGLEAALRRAGAVPGRFVGADRILASAADKRHLRETSGADAVEMESCEIRGLASRLGLPSATVRVISDAATEDLPVDFNALLSDRLALRYDRLAAHLVRHPGAIPGLLRFGRQTREAARRLGRVLEAFLRDWNGKSPA